MDAPVAPRLSARTRKRQWIMIALLVAAGVVNYVDRSTLAVANHTIAQEMHFSPGEMGALLSAFAWSYALFQLPIGAVTDRVGPRIMLTAGMVVWSLAQAISGTVQSFTQFLIARAGLGFGESPMFTAGARASVNWFPIKDRGVPLGLFNAASSLGPAIAPPLLTAIMLSFGWRAMFISMGLLGLVVAAAWWAFYRDPEHANVPQADIDAIHAGDMESTAVAGPKLWGELFAIPTTWAMMVGLFGLVYVSWLYVAWLPDYLERVRHVSTARTGILAALPQFAGFFGGVGGGYLSDWLARKNMDPIDSRKWPTAIGLVIAGALTAAAPFIGDTSISLAVMSAAMFFAYGAGSCSWALGATLTPPHLVATLEAVQNIGGSIGGGLAPLVTGIIVQRTGSFDMAFVVAAGASLVGAAGYAFVKNAAYARLGEAD